MVDQKELVSTLKKQHKLLNDKLLYILEQTEPREIVASLDEFKKNLFEHIKLEDEVFYPDYNNKKNIIGEASLDELAIEMAKIAKVVVAFLDKYSKPEVVSDEILNFKKELLEVISTLAVRIETEEEGIFEFYLQM